MKRFRSFLISTIVGGIVVLLPIGIFIWLVQFVFKIIRNLIAPLSKYLKDHSQFTIPDYLFDFLALAMVIAVCFILGLVVRTRLGNNVFSYFERKYLERLPLYGTIKETVQQFSGAKKMPFSQVVLVDVFNNGTRMTGFVTDEHESGNYTVFVPTGPNPTNGFIFHVPKSSVEHIDTQADDAMRSIIGIGVGSSDVLKY